ncbi:MAG: response regulator transcription factor [Anaerolineales bacterium]|nr:response regulator transcription factor [Anaerolineales bacterium]
MPVQVSEPAGSKILLIDDDVALLQVLEETFRRAGYTVSTATNGLEGLRQLYTHRPDLVILDLVMPLLDGRDTCRQIRQLSQVPLLVLTAWGMDEAVIVRSLEEGADDCLAKPITAPVLLAHVQALLRRASLPPEVNQSPLYRDGYLTVDLAARQVRVAGQPVRLSPTEYKLLACLVRQADRVVPVAKLLEAGWGGAGQAHIHSLHLTIGRLRRRLEENPCQPRYVLTEHGMGYRFKTSSAP